MRFVRGAMGSASGNRNDLESVRAVVRDAEAAIPFTVENVDMRPTDIVPDLGHTKPDIWRAATLALTAAERGEIVQRLIEPAERAGMVSAGELIVGAKSQAHLTSDADWSVYYPMTTAELSLTVRDPQGTASGWAGIDDCDWSRIAPDALAARALEKSRLSLNARVVEPGRYTAILEPQAVADLVKPMMAAMERLPAELGQGPFSAGRGNSKIGQRVLDPRLTMSSDPMDPEGGFIPFTFDGSPFRAVDWIKDGVLRELGYDRGYALQKLQENLPLQRSGAFRLRGSGTPMSIDEMIQNTKRGLLVTRLSGITVVDSHALLLSGFTRDGVWLIQDGKRAFPVKNFRFAESPLFALNNVEAIGAPVRVYNPAAPVLVPPMMVRDFNFAGLADAV